jgi:hypothetical protein
MNRASFERFLADLVTIQPPQAPPSVLRPLQPSALKLMPLLLLHHAPHTPDPLPLHPALQVALTSVAFNKLLAT